MLIRKLAFGCLVFCSLISASALAAYGIGYGGSNPIKEVVEPKGKFPKSQYVKVAVVQWAPTTPAPLNVTLLEAEAFKQKNREKLEDYIREAAAKGAEIVITPELGILGYPDIPNLPDNQDNFQGRNDVAPYVETIPGASSRYFAQLSKELGIYILIGLVEKDKTSGIYYNSVFVTNPLGKLEAKYRKSNLFGNEDLYVEPGSKAAYFNSPAGRIGILICADVDGRFPLNEYSKNGIEVVTVSASWTVPNSAIHHFTAVAKDYGFYVLASNHNYNPDSGVISPGGVKQSHIRQTTGVAYGYLPRIATATKP